MTLRTTLFDPYTGDMIKDPKNIRKNYLLSMGFWIDLLAAIPFFLISKWFSDHPKLILLNLLPILKLFRVEWENTASN